MSFPLRQRRKRTRQETEEYLRSKEEMTDEDDDDLIEPPTKRSRREIADLDNDHDADDDVEMMLMNDADDDIMTKFPSYRDVISATSSSESEIIGTDGREDEFEFMIDQRQYDNVHLFPDDDDYGTDNISSDPETENYISLTEIENDILHSETQEEISPLFEVLLQSEKNKLKQKRKKKRPGRPKKRGVRRTFKDPHKHSRQYYKAKRQKKKRQQETWSEKVWRYKVFKKIENFNFIYRRDWEEFNENDEIFKPNNIGEMDYECPHCGALLFKNEIGDAERPWQMCCKNGQITKDLIPPMNEPPKSIKFLLTGRSARCKFFKDNIYIINSALRLGTSIMHQKRINGRGVNKFIITGRVRHITPDFNRLRDRTHFNECQMYTYEPEEQLNNRLKLSFLDRIRGNETTKWILKKLQQEMMKHNWLVQTYKNFYSVYIAPYHAENIPEFHVKIHSNIKTGTEHKKNYAAPTGIDKIATMIEVNEEDESKPNHQQIVLTNKRNTAIRRTRTLTETHALADPISFPIFHPYGERGYCGDLKPEYDISMRDYYRYRLMIRPRQWNPFIHGGRLFEAWVTNQYAKIQQQEMNQLKAIQKRLRRDSYKVIREAVANNKHISNYGKKCNIIPSTVIGSARDMQKKYQNALAILRAFQTKPDIFLTVTANADWPEITMAIDKLGRNPSNKERDDIIARVFKAKLTDIMDDILNKHVLGVMVAHVYVIEFQKRGLPHAHCLLILHPDCKLDNNPKLYDEIITAQIPDPNKYPRAHALFAKHQIHGPCKYYGNCLRDGICTKFFPKPFQLETQNSADGYAKYKRLSPKDGGFTCKTVYSKDEEVDNRYAIPTNLGLLMKYECHINVEYCATIQSIKYVYKYIYKGSDKAFIALQNERQDQGYITECDDFIECRYFGPSEACWKIFNFKMGNQRPTVKVLPVHLPGEQSINFDESGEVPSGLNDPNNYTTELTEFFANNLKESKYPLSKRELGTFHDGTIRPSGPQLKYHEYPQFYHWYKKKWKRRTADPKRLAPTVSRMHWVNYADHERYFLRLLLLKRPGPTSFDDIKTINKVDGPLETFKEVCEKLGYLDDDTEFYDCMKEACQIITHSHQLRKLFATILNNNHLVDPTKFWLHFRDSLTYDIRKTEFEKMRQNGQAVYIVDGIQYPMQRDTKQFTEQMYNECLCLIEEMLQDVNGKPGTCKNHRLPEPGERINNSSVPKIIADEVNFDYKLEDKFVKKSIDKMNMKQRKAYETILASVYPDEHIGYHSNNKFFFLQAAAGTGKTFLLRTIASTIRSKADICLCNASSGIAATLFRGGKTMHCRFKIPLNVTKNSPLTISRQSAEAKLIKQAKIILWDEAPMGHKDWLLWLNRQLKDITGNTDELFGGKVVVLSGDFEQIPPVTPGAYRTTVINSSIKRCKLFKYAHQLKLVVNERLRKQLRERNGNLTQQQRKKLEKFDKWISAMGADKLPKFKQIDECAIKIPKQYISRSKNKEQMINEIYGQMNEYNTNPKYFLERNILCPVNKAVDEINKICLNKIVNQQEETYESEDWVGIDDCAPLFSKEFLNGRNFPGIPPHKLTLKTNIPIMLIRNIDHGQGLCNGTRLLITHLHKHMLQCVKLTDPKRRPIFIPRMTLTPNCKKLGYEFKRRTFPVRLAFAMTINKSQGQTLQKTMVYLPNPVFEHGQLYVAVSRVTTPDHLRIFMEPARGQGYNEEHNIYYTRNIVYDELLMKET